MSGARSAFSASAPEPMRGATRVEAFDVTDGAGGSQEAAAEDDADETPLIILRVKYMNRDRGPSWLRVLVLVLAVGRDSRRVATTVAGSGFVGRCGDFIVWLRYGGGR